MNRDLSLRLRPKIVLGTNGVFLSLRTPSKIAFTWAFVRPALRGLSSTLVGHRAEDVVS